MRMHKGILSVLGALLLGLGLLAPAAQADWGDALLGAAVGAGISAAADDDDDGVTYRRYRSFSDPYPYRTRYFTSTRSFVEPVYVYPDNRYRSFVRRRVVRYDDDDDD